MAACFDGGKHFWIWLLDGEHWCNRCLVTHTFPHRPDHDPEVCKYGNGLIPTRV